MKNIYQIRDIRPEILDRRLRVFAEVEDVEGRLVIAELPQRELSALLPRAILLGDGTTPSPGIYESIAEILVRQLVGRGARLWEYNGRRYVGFLSWRSIKFGQCGAPGVDHNRESGRNVE